MKTKENKGITLIALVVTIILILVLAGTSISMLTGENGILTKAKEAKEKTEVSSIDDQRKLAQAEALTNTGKTMYNGIALPEGFAPTKIKGEDSIDEGLVITDGYGNEYVWIAVPRTTAVYLTAGINITDFNEETYKKIETDLNNYTADYRTQSEYEDIFSSENVGGWFKDELQYNELKYKMLKSVYQNEGFWVGRYEAGIEENRKEGGDIVKTPISKANVCPYNYVTRTQAKILAEKVESGNSTSSIMFGIQWNLMLAFMHNVGKVDNELLIGNSNSIGNYRSNIWSLTNKNAKYSIDFGWNFKTGIYIKKSEEKILLSTGADSSFSKMNIYDFAGNVWEWTLEGKKDMEKSCVYVGGDYGGIGDNIPASGRLNFAGTGNNYNYIGFRVSIY